MSKFTPQELQEAYQKLPDDIKKLYSSEEVTNKLYSMGQKYNLHVDQIGQLIDEVGLVMVGLNPTKRFTDAIIERLKVDSELARNITDDVNKEIFIRIRENLQKQRGDDQPNRDQVLNEIENPPKAPTTKGIFEQKMGQIFNLPAEKADVTPKPATPQPENKRTEIEKPLKPWEQDPYLEKP